MYQEISILPRASVSSRQSGDMGGGGGIIGGPEGNGGIQHGKNGGGGGGGGGGPLNLRPGFPGPNPAPGTGEVEGETRSMEQLWTCCVLYF